MSTPEAPESPESPDSPGDRPAVPPPRRQLKPFLLFAWVAIFVLIFLVPVLQQHDRSEAQPSDNSTPADSTSYVLSVPGTLEDGRYTLSKKLTDSVQQAYDSTSTALRGVRASGGEYRMGTGDGDVVTYWGLYGHVTAPDAFAPAEVWGLGVPAGAKPATTPEDVLPPGTGQPVTCTVLRVPGSRGDTSLPVCVWSSATGAVAVSRSTPRIARQAPSAVDLRSLAALTATILDEVCSPAG